MVEESDRKCREHEQTQKAKEEEEEATDAAAGEGEGDKANSGARFQISRQKNLKFSLRYPTNYFSSRADFASISFVSCATAAEKLDSMGSTEEPEEGWFS